MFAYCFNNPINMIDRYGQEPVSLAAEWTAAMWWLPFVDGPFPVGDFIFWCGVATLAGVAVYNANVPVNSYSPITLANSETQYDEIIQPVSASSFSGNAYKLPSPKSVKINMGHILSGHGAGGNRGGPNKNRFPCWMTPSMIEKAIREAYKNAAKAGRLQHSWDHGLEVAKQLFRGKWSGGVIEFWYNYTTKTIETAWPK